MRKRGHPASTTNRSGRWRNYEAPPSRSKSDSPKPSLIPSTGKRNKLGSRIFQILQEQDTEHQGEERGRSGDGGQDDNRTVLESIKRGRRIRSPEPIRRDRNTPIPQGAARAAPAASAIARKAKSRSPISRKLVRLRRPGGDFPLRQIGRPPPAAREKRSRPTGTSDPFFSRVSPPVPAWIEGRRLQLMANIPNQIHERRTFSDETKWRARRSETRDITRSSRSGRRLHSPQQPGGPARRWKGQAGPLQKEEDSTVRRMPPARRSPGFIRQSPH